MKILSIQSAVAYGHVGNSAAVFPLQRLGHSVWPVHTVNFSNHTGYSVVRGPIIPADDVRSVIEGMEANGALADIDVVLTGYQGSAAITEVVLEALAKIRTNNPNVKYVADPVMGNLDRGVYVMDGIVPIMRDRVIHEASVITPNQFELGLLTGTSPRSHAETLEAIDAVRGLGPEAVLVTSVFPEDSDPGTVDLVVADATGAWAIRTPMLSGKITGSGDVTSALFTAHYLESGNAKLALERTTSSIFDLIKNTKDAQSPELLLIDSQDLFVNPAMQFEAWQIR